jgi:hypothetical protein
MKKKFAFYLGLVCICFCTHAQSVAINTDGSVAHSSAMLDVKTTSKGLLIPRMNSSQRTSISSPATGLMVFDTDTNSFWFFNGTAWTNLSAAGWFLTGNAGTNAANNFIGTIDNVPLNFRMNNQVAGMIGSSLTSFGLRSLYSNSTGAYNTATGTDALYNNISGSWNTGMGMQSLYNAKTAVSNTAVGFQSLFSSNASWNTAVGVTSLAASTSGYSNTAVGYDAMRSDTSGYENTAIGVSSLYSNKNASFNVATGFGALFSNTTAEKNTANGCEALYNSNGVANAAVGYRSLYSNTSGGLNTATGYEALKANTTGSYNTGFGYDALYTNVSGDGNTAIGSGADVIYPDIHNAGAFGYNALTNASGKIVIGQNSALLTVGSYVPWSNFSDGRFKNDVQNDVPGLAFITKLRPVTYIIDLEKLDRYLTQQMPDSIAKKYFKSADEYNKNKFIRHTGFIAQEVEEAARQLNYSFDGVNKPTNPTDNYSLAYSTFVVPLVKAVQEQQSIIDNQQKQIDEMKVVMQQLQQQIAALKKSN